MTPELSPWCVDTPFGVVRDRLAQPDLTGLGNRIRFRHTIAPSRERSPHDGDRVFFRMLGG